MYTNYKDYSLEGDQISKRFPLAAELIENYVDCGYKSVGKLKNDQKNKLASLFILDLMNNEEDWQNIFIECEAQGVLKDLFSKSNCYLNKSVFTNSILEHYEDDLDDLFEFFNEFINYKLNNDLEDGCYSLLDFSRFILGEQL